MLTLDRSFFRSLAAQINEAFGSMYAYCVETLGLDMEKVNVNGGAMWVGSVRSDLLRFDNNSPPRWVVVD
jgi:hypothetical protein